MKTLLKIIFYPIIAIFIMSMLFGEDEQTCYFEDSYGLNTILVSNVVSEPVLKYAKYSGASVDGYLLSEVKDEQGNWTVEVEAFLKAKNGFGAYSTKSYIVKAKLFCDSYKILDIKEN